MVSRRRRKIIDNNDEVNLYLGEADIRGPFDLYLRFLSFVKLASTNSFSVVVSFNF